MKTYKMSIKKFYSIKRTLDQAVFWRIIDKDTVEIKPAFKFARIFIENFLKGSNV